MEKSQLNVLSGKCYQKISVLSEILFGYFSSQAIDNSRLIKSHHQVESLDFFFFSEEGSKEHLFLPTNILDI